MNTKLTLSLDKDVIRKAKIYAQEKNVSLSFLIENYLQKIISEYSTEDLSKASIVNELSGIIDLDIEVDYQDEHRDYLIKKYK